MYGPPINPPETYWVYVDTECDHCGRILWKEWRGEEGDCRMTCSNCGETTRTHAWRQL